MSALDTNPTTLHLERLPSISETAPRHGMGSPGRNPQEGMPSGAEVVSMATGRGADSGATDPDCQMGISHSLEKDKEGAFCKTTLNNTQ